MGILCIKRKTYPARFTITRACLLAMQDTFDLAIQLVQGALAHQGIQLLQWPRMRVAVPQSVQQCVRAIGHVDANQAHRAQDEGVHRHIQVSPAHVAAAGYHTTMARGTNGGG